MKILVTGGAGFIGSNFVHYWLKKYPKDKVTVVDALTYCGLEENLDNIRRKIKFVQGDIRDKELIDRLIRNRDLVVHFAAETHVDRSIKNPKLFLDTNVMGTFNILDAVTKYKKKMHHVSTDEVFGEIPEGRYWKFTEETPYNPRSPYSASKASSDHLVRSYFNTYGTQVTISNCSNNYGPYQFPEKFIARAITDVIEGKKIKVYGVGKQQRDWLYVTDHCNAIDTIINKGKIGETYLVGGYDTNFNNYDIAKTILEVMGKGLNEIEFVKDRPGHDFKYQIDWSKINRELKWKPKHYLMGGLRSTIKWYKENEWWWKPLKERAEKIYQK